MARRRPKQVRNGTKALCGMLEFIHDVNVEEARAAVKAGDEAAAREAAATAEKARKDGLSWGCSWAQRA